MDLSELVTCKSCGYVISRPFDTTAEYRFFSNDDRGGDPTRVGAAQDPSLPQASLGTVILGSYGAAAKTMYKVRKYHTWNTVPYKERSLIQANERLTLIGLNHGINQSAIEASRSLYITIKEIGGRQGLSRDAMLAGCMYRSKGIRQSQEAQGYRRDVWPILRNLHQGLETTPRSAGHGQAEGTSEQ